MPWLAPTSVNFLRPIQNSIIIRTCYIVLLMSLWSLFARTPSSRSVIRFLYICYNGCICFLKVFVVGGLPGRCRALIGWVFVLEGVVFRANVSCFGNGKQRRLLDLYVYEVVRAGSIRQELSGCKQWVHHWKQVWRPVQPCGYKECLLLLLDDD